MADGPAGELLPGVNQPWPLKMCMRTFLRAIHTEFDGVVAIPYKTIVIANIFGGLLYVDKFSENWTL